MSTIYRNIPEYALVALGTFLYSTDDVTISYKRKSVIPKRGWRVIRNPNYCVGNCMKSIFVPVPPLVEGLRPRAEPSTPGCRAAASSPLSHSHSLSGSPFHNIYSTINYYVSCFFIQREKNYFMINSSLHFHTYYRLGRTCGIVIIEKQGHAWSCNVSTTGDRVLTYTVAILVGVL